MTELNKMYPGVANSVETFLTQPLSIDGTVLYVADGSVFGQLPNLAVLGSDQTAETILVKSKRSDGGFDVDRAFEGSKKRWDKATTAARNFTNYDYKQIVDNIGKLDKGKVDVKDGYGLSQNDYTNEDKDKVNVLSEKETEWTKLQEWKNHIIDKSNYKEVLDFSKVSLTNNTDGIHLRPAKIKYVPNKKFYEEFTQMKEPVQIGIFFPEEAIAGIPTQFTIYFSNKGSLTFWCDEGFRSFGSKCAVVDVSQYNPNENKNVKSKIIQVVPPNHIHSFRFEMMTDDYDPFQNGVSIVYTTLP